MNPIAVYPTPITHTWDYSHTGYWEDEMNKRSLQFSMQLCHLHLHHMSLYRLSTLFISNHTFTSFLQSLEFNHYQYLLNYQYAFSHYIFNLRPLTRTSTLYRAHLNALEHSRFLISHAIIYHFYYLHKSVSNHLEIYIYFWPLLAWVIFKYSTYKHNTSLYNTLNLLSCLHLRNIIYFKATCNHYTSTYPRTVRKTLTPHSHLTPQPTSLQSNYRCNFLSCEAPI